MTIAERLRQISSALPAHGSVTLTREDIEDLLVAEHVAPVTSTPDPVLDLTLSQAAGRIGRSVSTVRTWCQEGRLPNAYRLRGREWRIPLTDLELMLRNEAARHREKHSFVQRREPMSGLTLDSWRDYVVGSAPRGHAGKRG